MRSRPITALLLAGFALAGCAKQTSTTGPSPTATPSPTASVSASPSASPSPTASPGARVTVYELIDFGGNLWLAPERHYLAPGSKAVARAAMDELTQGAPQDPDHHRPFPEAARVRSVTIKNGTATVDWNAAVLVQNTGAEGESRSIQAAVHTLTEFSSVKRVRFTVEGKDKGTASNGRRIEDWWGHVGLSDQPFTREAYIIAPVTVWAPQDDEQVGFRIVAEGEAMVFEATVTFRLFDESGKKVFQDFATATEGAPGRGKWNIDIPLTESVLGVPPPTEMQRWRFEALEVSAKDGSDRFVESKTVIVGPLD